MGHQKTHGGQLCQFSVYLLTEVAKMRLYFFCLSLYFSVSLYQSVHPSVYMSECKNSVSTTWIFTKFKITQFY